MSESVEEYLEAIYSFNEKGETAKNTDLAEKLRVSPPSVTQMIKKLADEGLVTYEPYRGVALTGKGTAHAQRVVRKHRLLERFLYDFLRLSKDKVHEEACRLEHSISDEATAALCKALNRPETCPDDLKKIPQCTLETDDCTDCEELRKGQDTASKLLTQLSNLKPGEEGSVAFIRSGRGATQRLIDMGLCRGTAVKVVKAAPFHGPIEVSVRGTSVALGRGLAEKVFVQVGGEEKEKVHPHGPHHTA